MGQELVFICIYNYTAYHVQEGLGVQMGKKWVKEIPYNFHYSDNMLYLSTS